mmetsp:Transcript_6146/g.12622  ORF Transcript_6146/g.12622 Transcript_6146/m.12622 type:complete len:2180 (-) Transcript_6146:30-6569(-)
MSKDFAFRPPFEESFSSMEDEQNPPLPLEVVREATNEDIDLGEESAMSSNSDDNHHLNSDHNDDNDDDDDESSEESSTTREEEEINVFSEVEQIEHFSLDDTIKEEEEEGFSTIGKYNASGGVIDNNTNHSSSQNDDEIKKTTSQNRAKLKPPASDDDENGKNPSVNGTTTEQQQQQQQQQQPGQAPTISTNERELVLEVKQEIDTARRELETRGAKPCQSKFYVAQQLAVVHEWDEMVNDHILANLPAANSDVQATVAAQQQLRNSLKQLVRQAEADAKELGDVQPQLQEIQNGIVRPELPMGPPYLDAEEVNQFVNQCNKIKNCFPSNLAQLDLFEQRAYLPNEKTTSINGGGDIRFTLKDVQGMRRDITDILHAMERQLQQLETSIQSQLDRMESGLKFYADVDPLDEDDQSNVFLHEGNLQSIHYKWFDEQERAAAVALAFFNVQDPSNADFYVTRADQIATARQQFEQKVQTARAAVAVDNNDDETDTKDAAPLQQLHTEITEAQGKLDSTGSKAFQLQSYANEQDGIVRWLEEQLSKHSEQSTNDPTFKNATAALDKLKETVQSNKDTAEKDFAELGYVQPQLKAIHWGIVRLDAPSGPPYDTSDVAMFVSRARKLLKNSPRQLETLDLLEERAYLPPKNGLSVFDMDDVKQMQRDIQESMSHAKDQMDKLESYIESEKKSTESLLQELTTQNPSTLDENQRKKQQGMLDESKGVMEVGVTFFEKTKEKSKAEECSKIVESIDIVAANLEEATVKKVPTLSTTEAKHLLRLQNQIKAAQSALEKDGPKPCQLPAYVSQQEALVKQLRDRLSDYAEEYPSNASVKVAAFSLEELQSTLESNKHVASKELASLGYVQPQLQAIQYSIAKPDAPSGPPYAPDEVREFVAKCNKITTSAPRQLTTLNLFEERAYLPDDHGQVRFGMKDLKQMRNDIGELESYVKDQLEILERDIRAGKESLEIHLEKWAAMDLNALDRNTLTEHQKKLDDDKWAVQTGVAYYEERKDLPQAAVYSLLLGKMEVIDDQLKDAERIVMIDFEKTKGTVQREGEIGDPTQQVEHGTLSEAEDETDFDDRMDADDNVEKTRIRFRPKLYGRDYELFTLHQFYDKMRGTASSERMVVFLGGYSGTGKSALVEEFVRQVNSRHRENKENCMYLSGKFGQVKAGDPFSALMQALNKYMLTLLFRSAEDLQPFEQRLREFDIYVGSENYEVLTETLTPALEHVLKKAGTKSEKGDLKETASGSRAALRGNIDMIKFAFLDLVKALATEQNPMVFFIDDLQWSDAASLQIMSSAMKESSLKYVMFIFAYRSNEIDNSHGFASMMADVSSKSDDIFWREIQLSNLAPDSVGDLIADCLWTKSEDVSTLTEAIYVKTMGNVFFVKQAIEELVRKNVIYYDLVTFSWKYGDVSNVELQQYLTKDVISMVQSKLMTMPRSLQLGLSLAAYTNNSFDLDLLFALLEPRQEELEEVLTMESLQTVLDLAFQEGLVLVESSSVKHLGGVESAANVGATGYKFAHDRIREAACKMIPEGNERHRVLLGIARVLLEIGKPGEKDWMLFTAARHMNSVPQEMTNDVKMANLNLEAGTIAVSKGAFDDALVLFRAAASRLNRAGMPWRDHYALTLDVFNNIAESEAALGNHENAMLESETIFENVKSLTDKVQAQSTYIESLCELNKEDYNMWVSKAVEILAEHEINVPESPTYAQVRNEVIKFGLALRGRTIFCLTKFPVATDEKVASAITLANVVLRRAVVNTRMFLAGILAYRILRIALNKKIITRDIFTVVWSLTFTFRKREKFKNAFDYSEAGLILRDRFPLQTGKEDIVPHVAPIAVSSYQIPYQDTIQPWLDLHKQLMFRGLPEVGLACAMFAMYAHLCASLPLNALFDGKLILIEEMSRSLGRDLFVELSLLLRQGCYNISGNKLKSSADPLTLTGPVFNETEALAKCEGATLKSLKRDTTVMRLYLAVIFNDIDLMEQMLFELDGIPAYDNLVGRQHLRLTFAGIAALLVPKYKKNDGVHEKWASITIKFFEKLAKVGSPNAKPVLMCLHALETRSVVSFDAAIAVCSEAGLVHLAAVMNEQCGLWLYERSRTGELEDERRGCTMWLPSTEPKHQSEAALDHGQKHRAYLKSALNNYQMWGAAPKAKQLEERFAFLAKTDSSTRWKRDAQMQAVEELV